MSKELLSMTIYIYSEAINYYNNDRTHEKSQKKDEYRLVVFIQSFIEFEKKYKIEL